MPRHHDTQHSPYSPAQLYALVADVERYPEFLPWCRAARILKQEEGGFLAELMIAFKGFTESYVSRVSLHPPGTREEGAAIEVNMVQGPFRHLVNEWRFEPEGTGGTRIEFELDFAFRSLLLEKMIGGLFARATEKMGAAFKQRADALYGARPGQP